MGQLDFNYGWNVPQPNVAAPTYDHSEYQPCMGMMVCPHCGKGVMCHTVESHLRNAMEDYTMDLGTHYDKGAKKGGGGKFKRRPFLKATDIPAKGCQAKIQDFREAPRQMEYSDFLVDLAIGKKEFTWGLRSKSVTLNMLIDELGKNTDKWKNKTVKLVKGGNKGQYVNVG